MKCKKWLALALAACLGLGLCACAADDGAVYVQSVAELSGFGGIAVQDRFAGVLVSQNTASVQRDESKTIKELMVAEGDDVVAGAPLFSYDTDQLKLELDKQKLELEQLKATIDNYKKQITELEKERNNAPSSDKLAYTVEIQSLQVELKEAELNLTAKENSIKQAEALLTDAVVYAPVTGRIQSINENGYDMYGNAVAYITIQQSGAYRVKAMVGEQQLADLSEGTRMRIMSRSDESIFWMGTIAWVDYENPSQGNDTYYGATDEFTSASRYPFYVELDDTTGLILGQHVYLEPDNGGSDTTGLTLPSVFFCYDEEGATYVWAENEGKLEKRTVTLGDYDPSQDTFQVASGLSEADYIAFPDDAVCVEGAATTHEMPVTEPSEPELPQEDPDVMPTAEGEVG